MAADPVAYLRNAWQQAAELAGAATPGPWETEGDDPTDDEVMTVHDGEHGDWVGGIVAFVRSGAWGRPEEGRTQANMCLIADHAAPDTVLRRVEAERAVLEACDTVLSGWYSDETKELAHDVIRGLAAGWGWEAGA